MFSFTNSVLDSWRLYFCAILKQMLNFKSHLYMSILYYYWQIIQTAETSKLHACLWLIIDIAIYELKKTWTKLLGIDKKCMWKEQFQSVSIYWFLKFDQYLDLVFRTFNINCYSKKWISLIVTAGCEKWCVITLALLLYLVKAATHTVLLAVQLLEAIPSI